MPIGGDMPSGEKGEPGDITLKREGEPLRPSCWCSCICEDHPRGDGWPERWNGSSCGNTEIEARELNLPGTGALNEAGEIAVGIAGLCDADGAPWKKGVGNGKP